MTRNLVVRLRGVGSNGENVVTLADVRRHAGIIGLYMDGAPDLPRYRVLSETEKAGEQA